MKAEHIPKRRRHRKPPVKLIQTNTIAVVQLIGTAWSKDYRGGAGASARNGTPEAEPLPLPNRVVVGPSYLLHKRMHAFNERRYIRGMLDSHRSPGPGFQVQTLNDSLEFGGLSIRFEDDNLHVDYAWSDNCGMPKRYPRLGVLRLQKGEWGRLRFNERHSQFFTVYGWDASEWWYEKWVLNVGLFGEFDPSVFMATAPTKVVSMMDQLW